MSNERDINNIPFWIGLAAALLLFNIVYGQPRYTIKHYGTEDGLSHEHITSILKDDDGFMWFGTWDGVDRFDGHDIITYKSYPGDRSNLKNNRISEIIEGKDGYLWIRADDKQIYRFDKRTGYFSPALKVSGPKLSQRFFCTKVIPAKDNSIWLLSDDQGVISVANAYSSSPTFVKYTSETHGEHHLLSNHINFFRTDADGHIWIGTPKGLQHFAPTGTGGYKSGIIDNRYCQGPDLTSMVEDTDRLIFTTRQGSIIIYHKRKSTFIKKDLVHTSGLNNAIVSRKRNVIYCSTGAGDLLTLNRSDLSLLNVTHIDKTPIFKIYEDRSAHLWIEPAENGVFRLDVISGRLKYFVQPNYSVNNTGTIFKVFEDAKGYVWVNMKGHGFGYYDPVKDVIDRFHNDPNFDDFKFSNKVNHQYYDPAGILWLRTEQRGLEKIVFLDDDFHQRSLNVNSFIQAENEVRAIYNDSQNRLWMATKKQLYTLKNGRQQAIRFLNMPRAGMSPIYTIAEDHEGNFWFGTKANGLYKATPTDKTRLTYQLTNYIKGDKSGFNSYIVYDILVDKAGLVWIGTLGGGVNLARTNNGQTHFYNIDNVFKKYPNNSHRQVRCLEADVNGKVWAGTTDGLLILDPAGGDVANFHFKTFNKIPGDPKSLGNNDIQFIYRDNADRMWLCTSGGGLNLASDGPMRHLTFNAFTVKDGLPNDFILSCVQAHNGNLWIATQNGLSEFNIAKKHFKNYDAYNGLPQTGFSEGSCTNLPDGSLIFSAMYGYVQFNPDSITEQKARANMAFTGLQVNGKDVGISKGDHAILNADINYTAGIALRYDQNNIGLAYTLLDYRASDKQAYSYRLIGLDSGWINNDIDHRKINYSNLAPGNYTFQVKASNADRYPDLPIKTLQITILPPPWRTWWAYLIYLSTAVILAEVIRRVATVMLKLRQRVAVERQMAELKLNFFTNISHELRTPLTLILNPAEAIIKNNKLPAQDKEHVQVILKNANRMVRFINQLLDLRKAQSGHDTLQLAQVQIAGFIEDIAFNFQDLGKDKEITLHIESADKTFAPWIDAEKLDVVIYNLLSNAYKFSGGGTRINVKIDRDDNAGSFFIRVADEGIGVDKEKLEDIFELYYEGEQKVDGRPKGTGIGLALAKELIALHQGSISASKNAGPGITVTIVLKLHRSQYQGAQVVFMDDREPHIDHVDEISLPLPAKYDQDDTMHRSLVLLIEDNPDLRQFLAAQLQAYYRITVAVDGQDGWEKAIDIHPDLIITDIMMPRLNGIQLLDKLKHHTSTSHIPVILLSARSSIESQLEGLTYGADQYITKPFNTDLLIAAIANLVRRRKTAFEAIVEGHHGAASGPALITSKDEEFLKKIVDVVETHLADPDFDVDSFADATSMSRSAFFRKFKSLTNIGPVEFVRQMRVKKGKQLFDEGHTNIAQVAYAVGFNDAKYFGACFKKQYHTTAAEYVKERHQNI